MYEVYEESDQILPILAVPSPCEIRIELTDERINLQVGPRDWTWNRKTGEMIGAGTVLSGEIGPSAEDDGDQHRAQND